jgi:hypothetical protein
MKRLICLLLALLLIPCAANAATVRFDAYTNILGSALTGTDELQVWNNGNIRNITVDNLWSYYTGKNTYQPLDADLTYLAGVTLSNDIKTFLNTASTALARTALGLGTGDNPSFNSVHASGGNLAAANKQVTKAWQTGLPYVTQETAAVHGGKIYICTSSHTAGATTEPGVGADWETVWAEVQGGGSMTYPGAGIPNSTGSAWGTSYSLDTDLASVSGSDDSIPSAKATKSALDGKQAVLTNPVTGPASPTAGMLAKWGPSGQALVDGLKFGTLTDTKYCTYTTANGLVCNSDGSGAMTYPGSGIPNSTGSAWGTSYALDTDLSSVSASDDSIPSAKATKSALDGKSSTSGTSSSTFQVGTDGPKIKNNSGTIEARNAADDAYADIKGKDAYYANYYSTAGDGNYYLNLNNTTGGGGHKDSPAEGDFDSVDAIMYIYRTSWRTIVDSGQLGALSTGLLKNTTTTGALSIASPGTDYEVPDTQTSTHSSPSTTNPLSPTWTSNMHTVWYGATGTINLPAASGYAARSIMIYNTGSFTITIDPNASEVIVRDGTVQTGGVSMTLSSGAGNYVALLCDGVRWVTFGYKGTLAEGS